MSNTPIIFLDVDGVLVTAMTLHDRREIGRAGNPIANAACIDALNSITESSGADIVVSSAWRFSGILEMRAIAQMWGVRAPVIDLIPDLSSREPAAAWASGERWREIRHWMAEYGAAQFVILDDIKDMGDLAHRHICTEPETGLSKQDAGRAIQVLAGLDIFDELER